MKNWSIERKISGSFAAALLMLSGIGGAAYWSTNQLISMSGWVEHTHEVLKNLNVLLAQLSSAESGERGYIITGNTQYVDSFRLTIDSLNSDLGAIKQLTSDNPAQQQRLQTLQPLINQRSALLQKGIDLRRQKGFPAAQQFVAQGVGQTLSNNIRQIVATMIAEETRLLKIRSEQARLTAHNTTFAVGMGGVLAFGLIPLASFVINRDVTRRRQVAAKLQKSEGQLQKWVGELEERNSEISHLGELADMLQACFTLDEAYKALSEMICPLFPGTTGKVFLTSESKTLVASVAAWGNDPTCPELFAPDECWALRRGRSYSLTTAHSHLRCQHLQSPSVVQSLCVPLLAQGEALGVLHLATSSLQHLNSTKQLLAATVAEHVAIALANLKLRETLKNQSIRDPLTNLFNRRYMEESLEREVHRAERSQKPLGVIMLDVDHFKKFNDTFGHEAGDVVLKELGQFLITVIRSSDIACRYGGEEFMLLLPDSPLEVTYQRAEQVRSGMKQLNLQNRREALGTVTLSLGIASFPQHGNTAEAVTRAADLALYQAKAQGRDRAVIAEELHALEKSS